MRMQRENRPAPWQWSSDGILRDARALTILNAALIVCK